MLYIVGTKVTTKTTFDPRIPQDKIPRIATWLPEGLDWVLGRISKTVDADTMDYMFYCESNPKRTHTTTFPSCEVADTAIAAARGEKIVDEQNDNSKLNVDEKFKSVGKQLSRKESIRDRRASINKRINRS